MRTLSSQEWRTPLQTFLPAVTSLLWTVYLDLDEWINNNAIRQQ